MSVIVPVPDVVKVELTTIPRLFELPVPILIAVMSIFLSTETVVIPPIEIPELPDPVPLTIPLAVRFPLIVRVEVISTPWLDDPLPLCSRRR